MAFNNPFKRLIAWKNRKALTLIAGKIAKDARGNASWSRRIPGAIKVGEAKESDGIQSITIGVDLEKAPEAFAFEYGSGLHDKSSPAKYRIEPNKAPKLAFPISKWPNFRPLPDVDFAVFPGPISKKTYVMHPGVKARPYMKPAIESNKDRLLTKIADATLEALDEGLGARVTDYTMTLIRTDEIRSALITGIKANANIMAELDDANEVRELNWKGQEFTYPNIRVEMVYNTPSTIGGKNFCLAEMNVAIYIFSEEASSLQADTIAGIIADEYHDKHGLNYENITFTHLVADTIPAIAISERIWRSQVNLVSTIRRS